ncbi:MmcQ/YjbR family DNA-binding protein [Pseudosulfitobacter koreensis]|uniref:MmcQ/YjbR family DNA-binding protein n=1 Tax=Pseudosulfitobacter koreensis TaxID=2968472 RepID=A0ABT1YZ35_9RHOB|nr:MmcQ/YjbR family DNA-binding protein [Pseudosulfitobacter koreense]MCR8826144.1 MmcQ/YjbR family DNA-binding protein [Pseudosulfitobacter koreense]
MTREDFNAYCAAKPAATHVVQWGNADVWKVGGKVFAICGWSDAAPAFKFKVTDLAFEILSDMPGLRPAPYLASRGLKWIQNHGTPGLNDTELAQHIDASYDMIAAKLARKTRTALGL